MIWITRTCVMHGYVLLRKDCQIAWVDQGKYLWMRYGTLVLTNSIFSVLSALHPNDLSRCCFIYLKYRFICFRWRFIWLICLFICLWLHFIWYRWRFICFSTYRFIIVHNTINTHGRDMFNHIYFKLEWMEYNHLC